MAYCERAVEAPLRARHAARRADQPLALELPHDVVEALALLAEQRLLGHAHVLEREQRGVGRVHAELLELLLADHAGRVHVDEEQREAVVAGVRVGLRDEHDEVGAVAVRDVRLRAVDDPLVAVAHRARLDAGHVGAGVGLGDAEAGDLLAADRRHEVAPASAPRCRTGAPAGWPCRCAPPRPSRARPSCSRPSPRRARGCSSSRRPGRRTPPGRRGRGSRARPCAGRPSRGRSSPPTPPRAARAPSSRTRGSTRAAGRAPR